MHDKSRIKSRENQRLEDSFTGLISFFIINKDKFVKSRHSVENRSPDGLQLLERTVLHSEEANEVI
jgi:hypothetical protein